MEIAPVTAPKRQCERKQKQNANKVTRLLFHQLLNNLYFLRTKNVLHGKRKRQPCVNNSSGQLGTQTKTTTREQLTQIWGIDTRYIALEAWKKEEVNCSAR